MNPTTMPLSEKIALAAAPSVVTYALIMILICIFADIYEKPWRDRAIGVGIVSTLILFTLALITGILCIFIA